ncbi:FHA domain-containing protein FHA2 [Vitis vinifera]|uniref:FHA domain-containing protein FHA2 n=1 Tax=Vitis vinifera TaxID=29760 RepID=A0A438I452_VITVI|nr:FHA domain-containing protein FHA2 [Vitis vinifera]
MIICFPCCTYPVLVDKKAEARSRVDRDADNHQLLQLEEKDWCHLWLQCFLIFVALGMDAYGETPCRGPGDVYVSSNCLVLLVLSILYIVFLQLVEQYSSVWHHSRVRKYLTSEEWSSPESKGKPWFGLLMLLRKYPEHFVINTRSKGRITLEFVSLVSLLFIKMGKHQGVPPSTWSNAVKPC